VTETRLALPPAERLYKALCPKFPADSGFAAAGGIVTGPGGAPAVDVGVQILWKVFGKAGEAMLTGGTTGLETRTEEQGYFRICGLPVGSLFTAQTVVGERRGLPIEFRLLSGELKDLRLVLPRP